MGSGTVSIATHASFEDTRTTHNVCRQQTFLQQTSAKLLNKFPAT